jgi:hypothetical protein
MRPGGGGDRGYNKSPETRSHNQPTCLLLYAEQVQLLTQLAVVSPGCFDLEVVVGCQLIGVLPGSTINTLWAQAAAAAAAGVERGTRIWSWRWLGEGGVSLNLEVLCTADKLEFLRAVPY